MFITVYWKCKCNWGNNWSVKITNSFLQGYIYIKLRCLEMKLKSISNDYTYLPELVMVSQIALTMTQILMSQRWHFNFNNLYSRCDNFILWLSHMKLLVKTEFNYIYIYIYMITATAEERWIYEVLTVACTCDLKF